jgi:hypothetical protein
MKMNYACLILTKPSAPEMSFVPGRLLAVDKLTSPKRKVSGHRRNRSLSTAIQAARTVVQVSSSN